MNGVSDISGSAIKLHLLLFCLVPNDCVIAQYEVLEINKQFIRLFCRNKL